MLFIYTIIHDPNFIGMCMYLFYSKGIVMKKKILALFLMVGLGANGAIAKVAVSDDTLVDAASFALSTYPKNVTLLNRNKDKNNMKINFNVKSQGKEYRCYIVATDTIVSDAICSGYDGPGSKTCNALERAAKRC